MVLDLGCLGFVDLRLMVGVLVGFVVCYVWLVVYFCYCLVFRFMVWVLSCGCLDCCFCGWLFGISDCFLVCLMRWGVVGLFCCYAVL